jgi:hypothetical protein
VSFAAITFCVASQRVFIVASVCFVIDSVRKLLDTPSYIHAVCEIQTYDPNFQDRPLPKPLGHYNGLLLFLQPVPVPL